MGHSAEASAPATPAAAPSYVVGTGDVLQILVWKEPELTREVSVRLDGRITLPLLGDVVAAGRTPTDLGAELTRHLTRFVEAPLVTVAVAQANSTRIYVLGQVKTPGVFPLGGRMTVLQALALAGGFTEFAKTERILIIRDEPGLRAPFTINLKKLESDNDLSQNVALKPGDTIVVP
jgi:polysaccharide export outer membrane protein